MSDHATTLPNGTETNLPAAAASPRRKRQRLETLWAIVLGASFPLLLILILTGFPLHATWVFLPVSIAIVALFTAGASLILFTVASRFADIKEMYLVFVQTWFFLTPIVYHPSIVPPRYRFALWANPMYYLVQTFRTPIYDGVIPSATLVLGSFALGVLVLVTGWVFFCHRRDDMAYWS